MKRPTFALICAILYCAVSGSALASDQDSAPTDGWHDFDFEFGTWKTELSRLVDPLTGSDRWVRYEGTSVVRPILGGRANLVELSVEGPQGRIEGLSLRLYDPESGQWSLNFASIRSGALSPPVTGKFHNGRGEFYGLEMIDGRPIYVKFVITQESDDVWRFEQSFSDDGGESWEVNWIAIDTRLETDAVDNLCRRLAFAAVADCPRTQDETTSVQ